MGEGLAQPPSSRHTVSFDGQLFENCAQTQDTKVGCALGGVKLGGEVIFPKKLGIKHKLLFFAQMALGFAWICKYLLVFSGPHF